MLALSNAGARRLAYGFWRYEESELDIALQMLEQARTLGLDHIDTADVYGYPNFGGAEALLGRVRAEAPGLFAGAVLATKAGVRPGTPYNSSADYLAAACDASLKRLGVERVDLFYIHRHDLLAHPAEVAGALEGLAAAGKIGAVGVSNFTPAQVDALAAHLKAPIAAVQIEFSALHVAPLFDGALDQAMREEIAVAAWSPLAGGRLGDAASADPAVQRIRAALAEIAPRYGLAPEAAALAFLLRHPAGVTPILGTKTPARLALAAAALGAELERADWYAILEAARGARMP